MTDKNKLRKKFLSLRKKKYFKISNSTIAPLIKYIKKKFGDQKRVFIAIYYPSNYEFDLVGSFNYFIDKKIVPLLPVIKEDSSLKFVKWEEKDVFFVNKFGIIEPSKEKKSYIPNLILAPLLAFDNLKNRLGYGKGYYDRFLNKQNRNKKKIEVIGIAFSFQKYKHLPISKFDYKLNKIFTEKGFVK